MYCAVSHEGQTSAVTELLDRWCATLAAAGSDATAARQLEAGESLLARWSEPHRSYHTTAHLAAMLSTVDLLAAAPADATAVQLAAWFHDAVYDPRQDDNESASAALAETTLDALGIAAESVAEVARLVRLTATHDPAPDDANGALLCDADLAILAAPPSAYRRYAEAVRAEYAHVEEAAFRTGRAAVLRRLLAQPQLFSLASARDKWEKRARINLAIEVSTLTEGVSARKPLRP
jgi:predicted metal-dependent HD superfamily phosphohydrolase